MEATNVCGTELESLAALFHGSWFRQPWAGRGLREGAPGVGKQEKGEKGPVRNADREKDKWLGGGAETSLPLRYMQQR